MEDFSADSINGKLQLLKQEFGVESDSDGLQRRFLQFQAAFRFSQEGQLLLTKNGDILAANPAICHLLGYEMSEIQEKSRADLLDEADEQVKNLLQTRNENGNANAEIYLIHKNGSGIPVELSTILFEIEEERFAAVTIRDLRPRLALEAQKKKSDTLVNLLMENTEASFYLLDRELKVVSANKAARLMNERLLNKPVELGMSILNLAQEEQLEELKALYKEVLCGLKRESEIPIPQTNGENIWLQVTYTPLFDEVGKVQGVFVNAADVTATKNADAAFRKQKALFESLVQRTSDGTLIVDAEGKVLFANESSRTILGYNPQPKLGNFAFEYVYKEDIHKAIQALADLVMHPDLPVEIELRLVDAQNGPVWCELRAINQLLDPNIGGIVIHFHDIRHRKAHEEELRESRKSLYQLLNNTEESFILCDRKLRITAFNEAANKRNLIINNRPMQKGGALFESISPQRINRIQALAKHVFKKGIAIRTQARYIQPDGKAMILSLEYTPVFEDDGTISGLCIIANDVTEMHKAENALLKSKQRLMLAQKIAKLGSWDYELSNDQLLWSDEVYQLFGLDKETVSPSMDVFYTFVHTSDKLLVEQAINDLISAESLKLDIQHRYFNKGKLCWLHQRGEVFTDADGNRQLNVTVQDISEQKAINQEMALSNERFRTVEMATNDVIWDLDFITNELIWAPSIERVFGYPHKNISEYDLRWWESKMHPEDLQRVSQSLYKHQYSREKIWTEQYRFQHNDGTYRYVLDRGYTFFDQEGAPLRIIGSIQDISETVSHQRQIAEYADRLEGMVNSITDAFFTFDKNWHFVYLNPVAETLFERSGISSRNKVIWEVFPALDQSELQRSFRKSVTAKKPQQFEFLLFDKWFAFNLYPQKSGLSVYARDVTSKKLEDERLHLLESVITNTNDAVLITEAEPIDALGPRIIFVNEAFTRMTGYQASEVIGKTPRILQGPETDRDVLAKIRAALEKWEPIEVEVINYRKDGEPFWSNFSIVPLADKNGWITHWISLQRNVTGRKESETAQKQLNEELTKQNYGLEQFSFITSHNLRAPVANLLSILDLLDREKPENPENVALMDMIELSTHRMNETLNELSKVLKIKGDTHPKVEVVNFQSVYSRMLGNINALLKEAGGEIVTHFDPAEMVYTRSHIDNIMLNMITNAIKYRSKDNKLKIELNSSIVDGYVVLSFKDNGLGIDLNRYRSRLFGMYQRFHNNADSRGLGLYIVHAQVQALGGKIEVDSKVNVGTTFRVYLKNSSDARINH